MKIIILAPYPLAKAPSQRFRFEHYLDHFKRNNIDFDFEAFLSEKAWANIYQKRKGLEKLYATIIGFWTRLLLLMKLGRYDTVLIHRELSPLGPPIFEWIIAKLLKKKIIYDFDDAIWLPDPNGENWLWKTLKWRSKVASICKWSWKVSAGNDYLADFARQYCDRVVVFPTVVNTATHRPQAKSIAEERRPVIGWTGSHSTLFYLNEIYPVLQTLEKEIAFDFLVIANKNPKLPLKHFRFIEWNKTTEIEDLSKIDIGIMPLESNEWAKGKCGFKLIQYLALGIPAVASPVGVNSQIVINNKTGFLASSQQEWKEKIALLLQDTALRNSLGKAGRDLIEEKYSVRSQKNHFLGLFED